MRRAISRFSSLSVQNRTRGFSSQATQPKPFLTEGDIAFLQTNPLVGVDRANERIDRVNDQFQKRSGKKNVVLPTVKNASDSYQHPFVTDAKAGIIFDQLLKSSDPVLAELDQMEEKSPNIQLEDTIELHAFISAVIDSMKAVLPKDEQPTSLKDLQKDAYSAALKAQPQFNPPKFWQSELLGIFRPPSATTFDLDKELYGKEFSPDPEHWEQAQKLLNEAEEEAEKLRLLEDPPVPDRP